MLVFLGYKFWVITGSNIGRGPATRRAAPDAKRAPSSRATDKTPPRQQQRFSCKVKTIAAAR